MSEYQYYEFRAVDQPLTSEQMSELRKLSSRAVITSTSFTNTYNFGNFGGNPRNMMERYFDAYVYVSNFGSNTLILRLPRTVLPDDTLAPYAMEDGLEWWATDYHTLIEWQIYSEPDGEWEEGEGWLAQLLPIRDELVRGDYRSLYIGWLAAIANEQYEEKEEEDDYSDEDEGDEFGRDVAPTSTLEPPVPAGLRALTASQTALAEFLGVDSDLIAAAAKASSALPTIEASDERVGEWVAQLPELEVRAAIVRLIRGEGQKLQTELQGRFHRSLGDPADRSGASSKRRTAAEIIATAEQMSRERVRRETEERERKRRTHLEGLVPRFSELWTKVYALADEQKSSTYDQACALLVDMRDAYDLTRRRPEFNAQLASFADRNSRRSALIRRLKETHLIKA